MKMKTFLIIYIPSIFLTSLFVLYSVCFYSKTTHTRTEQNDDRDSIYCDIAFQQGVYCTIFVMSIEGLVKPIPSAEKDSVVRFIKERAIWQREELYKDNPEIIPWGWLGGGEK